MKACLRWVCVAACAMLIHRPAAAFDPPVWMELALQLDQSMDGCYQETAQEALSLEDGDFEAVLAVLRAGGPMSPGSLVADALQLRRCAPALAAEFDERVHWAETHPEWGSRSMRPRYTGWWPYEGPSVDALCYEVVLKHTAHEALRWWYVQMARQHWTVANTYRALAMAWREGTGWCTCLRQSSPDLAPDERDRLTPILVQLYVFWRLQGLISAEPAGVLAAWGGPAQADALRQICDFEIECCLQRGVNPWWGVVEPAAWVKATGEYRDAALQVSLLRQRNSAASVLEHWRREEARLRPMYELHIEQHQAGITWTMLENYLMRLESGR